MDTEDFPPPPPEVLEHEPKAAGPNDEEEDEGEQFDFDSGDEIPEADRQALVPPSPGPGNYVEHQEAGAAGDGNLENTEQLQTSEPAAEGTPAKVNPYSVINISPIQEKDPSSSPEPSPPEECASPSLSGGYSVPVPCGYAVPSNLPLIVPAYCSPVIIRSVSVDDEGTQSATEECHYNSVNLEDPQNSEDNQTKKEDDALAKWVADPANTAWMENPDEVIYDDVPREDSDSEPEEMIYDDVENGDDGGNSSLEYGWSSSEFESYEEQSDSECKNGIPSSFLRGNHKRHMQKLMRAAREGTKDGLEKTKAAVKKGRSFIRTKSFISQDHRSSCLEEEEQNLFIDVDCMHAEAIMTPMPEGLSQQQVVRRYILGSVVDSEKNYVDALKRILEQYEKPLSDMEPKLLSERKLKMVFYRIKEILQCHSMFQIALASRVSEWDSVEMIGDVFVASFSKSMVLDAYSEYVNNFSTAVGILKKSCATKPAFLDFLKQCQESSPDRITLYGLMMKPIQRFPQFILLLQDMLKNTNKGHPDRLPLQMALTELETLAEKLNERKRDADQRCEIKQIAKAMNERYLNKLLSSGNRYLIRTDDMVETVYNDKGEIIKTKERRLFMLNDVLMCATVNIRSSYESSGTTTTGQRYLLKWSVPLGQVDVIEYGSSEGQGDNCRFPPQLPAENVIINSKPTEDNLLGWFCIEDDGNQIKKEKHPLLVRHMPVMMAKQQEFKVECAAYNPEPYLAGETESDSCAVEHGFLWIGSCTNQMGQVAIVSFQSSGPKVIECFNVESRILCMVYIPEEEKLKEQNKAPDSENVLAKTSNVPTICLGMEEGSISIYKSCQGSKKIRLQHFFTPEKSTVMSLTYRSQYLFAGLVNGNVSIYTKAEDGTWNTEPQKIVKLGVLPVRSLLVMEETIWAACGGQIFIISTVTHSIENHFEAHQEEGMVISHMAVAGVGVWIAFTSGSTLRLFHTETLKHLQDVNIATPVHNMLPGQQRVSVTSLLVCHGLLLVGTNLGIIVALPVPRLQGIPKVTGRGMVSYHAHNSPVKFLVTATSINKKNRNKLRNSLPPGSEPRDDDQRNVVHSERPGSSLSNTQDTAVWLGDSAGSIAQRSDLSSSSGSLTLSHGSGSLEHRPEDSNIYELLKDQNISFKSKRQKSKKMKASSVLVISGGQGHRRVNKKTKQQRQDELVSSVMVWQIPLLNI
ncbi:rho guanine nucleotide exchange factor 10 isoform X4 [Ammospiza nelsoni]|uniref:rho guanine nucleotide exchange factor 10 isoform X4 n=1 Tax=Ammospiza nelsoni TaxID=2857394 RepID=UPI00286BE26B|nr:rho guanine nucleotide exchange factor 10 isoform X4 [Ammospiza nelsoni]